MTWSSMDCLKAKKDTVEQQLKFLLGQNGGFAASEHKLYSLAVLCLQPQPEENIMADHIVTQNNVSADNCEKEETLSCQEVGSSVHFVQTSSTAQVSEDSNEDLECDASKFQTVKDADLTTKNKTPCCGNNIENAAIVESSVDISGSSQDDRLNSQRMDEDSHIRDIPTSRRHTCGSDDTISQSDAIHSRNAKEDLPISDICTSVRHICSSDGTNCGCQLFLPKKKLPAVFFQQTYTRWKSAMDMSWRIRLMRKKPVIYIQPFENFPEFIEGFQYRCQGEERHGFFAFLKDFLSLFFMGMDVRLMKTKLISEYGWKVKQRFHHRTNKEQLLVSDLYTNMTSAIPKDGFCLLGITWTDLYPTEQLNFVLGEASSQYRSGVFCFGRFEPKAYVGDTPPPPVDCITGDLIFRMIKLITHETCHIYGLSHCVFFHCSMNESSSMKEALHQPLFLCPVCLKKLQKACHFDLVQRYDAMLKFLEEICSQYPSDFISKATVWLRKCVAYMKGSNANIAFPEQTEL